MNSELVDRQARFSEYELDEALVRAVESVYKHPSLVQKSTIPLALEGRDVVVNAPTGSGKTAAYVIPVLNTVLQVHGASDSSVANAGGQAGAAARDAEEIIAAPLALILVPSTELCHQVSQVVKDLLSRCVAAHSGQLPALCMLSTDDDISTQRSRLRTLPAVVVATPGRLRKHLAERAVTLDALRAIVLDEADLFFDHGFEQDMEAIAGALPSVYQAFMMSATLGDAAEKLRHLILRNAATVKLTGSVGTSGRSGALTEYEIRCAKPDDKYLLLYALLKLQIVTGKVLIFVNHLDTCYRVKLFLDRFSMRAAVLNSQLPQNSRRHIIDQFNRGVIDLLIATDEAITSSSTAKKQKKSAEANEDKDDEDDNDGENSDDAVAAASRAHTEYSSARGVDFKSVGTVVNFDFPLSLASYTHRVGRTARGTESGTALSLVAPKKEAKMADRIGRERAKKGFELKTFNFKMALVEGFRYRVGDVLSGISKQAVREARIGALKGEILNSERLRAHFEDNPHELELLQHDRALKQHAVKPHLQYVPKYLLPANIDPRTVNRSTEAQKRRRERAAADGDERKRKRPKKWRGKERVKELKVAGTGPRRKRKAEAAEGGGGGETAGGFTELDDRINEHGDKTGRRLKKMDKDPQFKHMRKGTFHS